MTYLGIGAMSGTSLDGLDLVACTFTQHEDGSYAFTLDQSAQVPLGPWHSRLLHLPEQSAEVYAKTHVYFGHWLGKQFKAFIEQHDLQPDFVAMHGQTIFHQPQHSFTAQVGDGETAVSYLACPLVSNFRNKDVALGGEGAPLIPIGERYLFPEYELFLNLGGFCNLTFRHRALDVGPCNIVLNHLWQFFFPEAQTAYDPDGALARSGQVDEALLAQLDALPYYPQRPPKSLGWEWVRDEFLPQLNGSELEAPDLLRTVVEHVARQIGLALTRLKAGGHKLLITGGGRHHGFLMERLTAQLAPLDIELAEADPAWVDYKEAIVFAFLGLRLLQGQPTTLASATGARQDVVSGSIHVPAEGGNWGMGRFGE
jgi:anhydro-N-acetylmuramic acid kinase